MWNAFPFHPYKKEMELSNRTPTKAELQIGKQYIELLIKEFASIKVIGAIGEKAYNSLIEMELEFEILKIRNPANGGKKDFAKGIEKLINI